MKSTPEQNDCSVMAPRVTETIAYLNGTWLPLSEARISVLDRGFIFGDGVYEVIPVYAAADGRRKPFRLEQHLARLERSLNKIQIPDPLSKAEWHAQIEEAVSVNAHKITGHCLVYIQVTRGVALRAQAFPQHVSPTVFMMTIPWKLPDPDILERGVAAVTAPDIRWLQCDIKSTSLLGNVLMAQYAVERHAYETILLREGWLTEGTTSNVWVAKGGRLLAPPCNHLILEGIRYALIKTLAHETHLIFEVRPIHATELRNADEIMLTSAGREILPVTQLDGQPVGDGQTGPVFNALYTGYQRAKEKELWSLPQEDRPTH